MVDLCQEAHFGWAHRILFRKKELELEYTAYETTVQSRARSTIAVARTFKGTTIWPLYGYIEVAEVIVMWKCCDPWRRVINKSFGLLQRKHKSRLQRGIRADYSPGRDRIQVSDVQE